MQGNPSGFRGDTGTTQDATAAPLILPWPTAPWPFGKPLFKEAGNPAVYMPVAGAKFLIQSQDELFALGYDWSQVQVVPDGGLASLGTIPAFGTALRERDRPEVFCICRKTGTSDVAVHVPTPAALNDLGITWDKVHVIPAGGLDRNGIRRELFPSTSSTPGSMLFDANGDGSNPGTRWPRDEVPGITLPNGNQIVELRGWIHVGGPNLHDPDFSYGFTPDPEWLDYLGVDLATFVKVGDICNGYMGGGDAHACQNDFHIKLEVNGWPLAQPRGPAVPDDWQEYPWSPGIKWPFDPAAPTGGSLPDQCYVRISGSLVTDTPHNNHYASPDYQDAMTIWQGIEAMTSAREPGRWTEMHPPDIIEPLDPPKTPTVRLVGIAVVARSFALNPLDTYKEYTTDLAPLGQRPPGKKAFVKEFVGPETVFGSIVEGNGGLNGARITIYDDHVNVHVKVVGRGFNGTPGKFKGVYELWWG